MILRLESMRRKILMQKALLLVMVISVSGLLSGCGNTFNGMGRDIESAGQSIQRSTQ